jgi:ribose 5-phosphate isomerase
MVSKVVGRKVLGVGSGNGSWKVLGVLGMAWAMVLEVVGRKVLGVGSGNGSRKVIIELSNGLEGSRKEGLGRR